MKIKVYIYPLSFATLFLLSFSGVSYVPLVYVCTFMSILMMLDKLGRGIVLREVIAVFNVFTCLFMPLIGYLVFNRNHDLALLFVRYMPVSAERYFSYALPAVTGFVTALCWPLANARVGDEGYAVRELIRRCQQVLEVNKSVGLWLLAIGLIAAQIRPFMPQSLQYIFSLLYFSSFTGLLYLQFSRNFRYKRAVLIGFVLFIIYGAFQNGMFTIFAYMGMTIFSFFVLGRWQSLMAKLLFFCLGALLLMVIQSVKPEYRAKVLMRNKDDKALEFLSLASQRIENLESGFTPNQFFPIYYRTNQGFYVGLVMKRFPHLKPFDNGRYLGYVNISSFVPRVLWPDKPTAGGYANMKYFAGVILKGFTTNVGPLGEGYGSFGATGGIIFMIILGVFIRLAYALVFKLAENLPLLIFWLPVLFYEVSYSAENDTLQITNSLFKAALFIFILHKLFPFLLGRTSVGERYGETAVKHA